MTKKKQTKNLAPKEKAVLKTLKVDKINVAGKSKAGVPSATKPRTKPKKSIVEKEIKVEPVEIKHPSLPNHHEVIPHSLFTEFDIGLFRSGTHSRLYEKMGAHLLNVSGEEGVYFAVWAPNALQVSVIGHFNLWNKFAHKLFARWDGSGIWEGFIPGIGEGESYKYYIESYNGAKLEKGDPYAYRWELRPDTASITWDLAHQWNDKAWMKKRKKHNGLNNPISVYEVHLGSWKRNPINPEIFLSYRALAVVLPSYCREMGFTHVEFMPVMEHPYDGSWGYQQTGYFAATSRFGNPQDFMYLVDELHRHDIGVLLDWVPSHFPYDAHGLFMFDGTHLYEHADMRKGFHPDWKSYIFNSGRSEVKCFLISNALFWLDKYHIDGLRVDAVASMLQLNYSREDGEWIPNEFGGSENLDNVALIKQLNETVYKDFPDTLMVAEESSTWPGVTHPTYANGLGFGLKWMMGWMNDTLTYFKRDPMYRSFYQNDITFSLVYAFSENFMLPLSHDEVVHGKAAMVAKMPGDEWQRFANLRLLYAYMWTHPGTKLLFMGNEFAQTTEWDFQSSLHWHLLEFAPHQGMQKLVAQLNNIYRTEPALYEYSSNPKGFEWIAGDDIENCILVFARKGKKGKDTVIVVLNFTPVSHRNYRIGIPKTGSYKEIFNSDDKVYWGTGIMNGPIKSEAIETHGRGNSITISIPPFGALILKRMEN
jgi:1,4-alpha-glucan branching enzyme